MNPATQIEGELLARTEAGRAQAHEVLMSQKRTFFSWQYLLLSVVGAAVGWFVSTAPDSSKGIIAAVAGAGFFLAAADYREAAISRRRIDALVVLAKANGAL